MPQPTKTQKQTAAAALVALVGAGVAMALGHGIPQEESGRNVRATVQHGELVLQPISGKQYLKAYLDVVGVPTACDGLTRYHGKPITIKMQFTEDQCETMLIEELLATATVVMKETPGLARSTDPAIEHRREGPRFAAISVTYNIGNGNYGPSTARRRFNAGDYPGGCTALTWFNRAGGKINPGLQSRRQREYIKCTKGLAA